MDDLIGRLSDKIARPTSRRGFMGSMGKAVLGGMGAAAGIAAGLAAGGAGTALALDCCQGAMYCGFQGCPTGTSPCGQGPFQPYNCCSGNQYYTCYSCCSGSSGGVLYCSYSVFDGACPQGPRSLGSHGQNAV
jgi:hypothetical protein